MELSHLHAALTIAERGSISAASKDLYISSVSLLQQLNQLEDELGFKIFHRSPRGVKLTAAGKHLFENGQHILHHLNSLFDECRSLADQDNHLIRISLSTPHQLIQICEQYLTSHPEIRIEYDRLDSLTANNIIFHFSEGRFDIIQTGLGSITGKVVPYDVIAYPADRLCCLCSSDHPLSSKSVITLDDLDGYTLSTFSNFSYSIDKLDSIIKSKGLSISILRTLYSEKSVLSCCFNKGIYIMQEQAAHTFPYLTPIPIEPAIPCYIGLAYMKDAKPAVHQFAQYVRDHMDVIAAQYE